MVFFHQAVGRDIRVHVQAMIRKGGEQGMRGAPLALLKRVPLLAVFLAEGSIYYDRAS